MSNYSSATLKILDLTETIRASLCTKSYLEAASLMDVRQSYIDVWMNSNPSSPEIDAVYESSAVLTAEAQRSIDDLDSDHRTFLKAIDAVRSYQVTNSISPPRR